MAQRLRTTPLYVTNKALEINVGYTCKFILSSMRPTELKTPMTVQPSRMHKYQKALLYQTLPFTTSIKVNTPWQCLSLIYTANRHTKNEGEYRITWKNIPVCLPRSLSLSGAITNSNERHCLIGKTMLEDELLLSLTGNIYFLIFF